MPTTWKPRHCVLLCSSLCTEPFHGFEILHRRVTCEPLDVSVAWKRICISFPLRETVLLTWLQSLSWKYKVCEFSGEVWIIDILYVGAFRVRMSGEGTQAKAVAISVIWCHKVTSKFVQSVAGLLARNIHAWASFVTVRCIIVLSPFSELHVQADV